MYLFHFQFLPGEDSAGSAGCHWQKTTGGKLFNLEV